MSSVNDFLSKTEKFLPSKRQAKAIKKKKMVVAECCVCGGKPIVKHKRCDKCLPDYEAFLKRNNAGKRKTAQSGYIYAYDEEGNHGLLHRQTMEKIIGRKLLPHESVVFADGDRSNCDPDNLVLVLKKGITLSDLVCPCCDTPYLTATSQTQRTLAASSSNTTAEEEPLQGISLF